MSTGEVQPAAGPASQPRMIRLKWAMWIAVVLVLALVVLWAVKSIQCNGALKTQAEQSAQNLASAIAAFANKDIVARNYRDLQDYSDNLVRNKPIAFIAIIDSRDRVVVHTNREFLGKRVDDLAGTSGVVEASVPVMDITKQAGTVRVGLRLK